MITLYEFLVKDKKKIGNNKEYELFKSVYGDIYIRLDDVNDINFLVGDNKYTINYYISEIKAYTDDEEVNYIIYIRPTEVGHGYSYYPVKDDDTFTFKSMNKKITASDFNLEYWKKNKWTTF